MSAAEELFRSPADQEGANKNGAGDCVAFIQDAETRQVVESALEQVFHATATHEGGSSAALTYLVESVVAPKSMIIDLSDTRNPLDAMLSVMAAVGDDLRLIGIGDVNDVDLYREMIEAGMVDYLVKPVTAERFNRALQRLQSHTGGPDMQALGKARRIAVMGSRGGVGATTVAIATAWQLAEKHGQRTVLVDLDLDYGTVALNLDLEPTRGLAEAMEDPDRIDSLFLNSAAAKVNDSLQVLATEDSHSSQQAYSGEAVEVLMEALSRGNDAVVIDLPRPAFALRRTVSVYATDIVIVTELTLPGLRDAMRMLRSLKEENSRANVFVVANRVTNKQDAVPKKEFEKALEMKITLAVPDEPKAFQKASNTGRPILVAAKNAKPAKMLAQLVDTIFETKPEGFAGLEGNDIKQAKPAKKKSNSLFAGLFQRNAVEA